MRRISIGVKTMAELRGPYKLPLGPYSGPYRLPRNPLKPLGGPYSPYSPHTKTQSKGLGTHGRVADRCIPRAAESLMEILYGLYGLYGPALKSLGFFGVTVWTVYGPCMDHTWTTLATAMQPVASCSLSHHAACRIMASKGPSHGGPAAGNADRERTRFAEFFEMGQPC